MPYGIIFLIGLFLIVLLIFIWVINTHSIEIFSFICTVVLYVYSKMKSNKMKKYLKFTVFAILLFYFSKLILLTESVIYAFIYGEYNII